MAKYKSKYLALSFYVNEDRKQFSAGTFETDDSDTIAVLDGISDAQRVDEPKATKPTEAKPASKAPARKTSAK